MRSTVLRNPFAGQEVGRHRGRVWHHRPWHRLPGWNVWTCRWGSGRQTLCVWWHRCRPLTRDILPGHHTRRPGGVWGQDRGCLWSGSTYRCLKHLWLQSSRWAECWHRYLSGCSSWPPWSGCFDSRGGGSLGYRLFLRLSDTWPYNFVDTFWVRTFGCPWHHRRRQSPHRAFRHRDRCLSDGRQRAWCPRRAPPPPRCCPVTGGPSAHESAVRCHVNGDQYSAHRGYRVTPQGCYRAMSSGWCAGFRHLRGC